MNEEIEYGIVAHLYNELSMGLPTITLLSDDCQKARHELEISPAEQDDSPKNLIMPQSIDQFQLWFGEYSMNERQR